MVHCIELKCNLMQLCIVRKIQYLPPFKTKSSNSQPSYLHLIYFRHICIAVIVGVLLKRDENNLTRNEKILLC